MLDDLRNSALEQFPEEEIPQESEQSTIKRRRRAKKILGMTAMQRFIIAVLLLLMTCVAGMFCLVATGSIWI